jgi:hypothetical protein
MYTLGITLSIIAFGSERRPPREGDDHSTAEGSFLQLVDGMTSRSPDSRLTLENAFLNPLLASVRLVNGVPVETMLTTIHGTMESVESGEKGAWFTSRVTSGPTVMLQRFIAESGPTFQVVSTNSSCTLYSVKCDPRRRRRASSAQDGSPSGALKGPS